MSEGSLFLGEYPTTRLQMLEPWSSLQALQEAEHLFPAAQRISLFQAAWLVLTTYLHELCGGGACASDHVQGLLSCSVLILPLEPLSLKLAWEEIYTTC